MPVAAENRSGWCCQTFIEDPRGGHQLERGSRFVNPLNGKIQTILIEVFPEVQVKGRTARQRQNLAGVRIHQDHRAAGGFEFFQGGVHFFLDDRLQSHVDCELDVEPGLRWLQAVGSPGHGQPVGITVMFALPVDTGEGGLHRGFHPEAAGCPEFRIPLIVGLLNLAGESNHMRGQRGHGVLPLDRVLELKTLDPVLIHRDAQAVGHILRQILGDGNPLAFAGFDLPAEFLAVHTQRFGQYPHRICQIFAADFGDLFVGVDGGEDIAANGVDKVALFGGIQIVPFRRGAGFPIGKAGGDDIDVAQVHLVHENRGHRVALGQRFIAAVHNHPSEGTQFFNAMACSAGCLHITVAVPPLDPHDSPR